MKQVKPNDIKSDKKRESQITNFVLFLSFSLSLSNVQLRPNTSKNTEHKTKTTNIALPETATSKPSTTLKIPIIESIIHCRLILNPSSFWHRKDVVRRPNNSLVQHQPKGRRGSHHHTQTRTRHQQQQQQQHRHRETDTTPTNTKLHRLLRTRTRRPRFIKHRPPPRARAPPPTPHHALPSPTRPHSTMRPRNLHSPVGTVFSLAVRFGSGSPVREKLGPEDLCGSDRDGCYVGFF